MGKKMKILIIEPIGGLAGSERSLFEFLSNIKGDEDWNITVFCPKGEFCNLIRKYVKVLPFGITDLHKKNVVYKILNFINLLISTIIIRPQIIHINQAGIYKHVGLICKIFKIPLIIHVRIIEDAKRLRCSDDKNFNIKKIIVNSKFTGSYIKKCLKKYLKIVYSSVSHFLKNAQKTSKIRRIGIVGRITKNKKQHIFVKASKNILPLYKNIQFLLFGNLVESEYLEELKKIAGNDWNTNIIYKGELNPKEIFSQIEILVHTTEIEPLGRVVLEAIAEGIPVIVPDKGGTFEIAKALNCGLIFKTDDIKDLENKIKYALKNYEKLKDETLKAQKKLKEIFGIENYIKEIKKIYQEVLNK